ncbi:hypothetical protein FRC19_008714 [Serendipita sp. 401]|nr:hypothetical protein FRC19_008714 [Serendipita sp. 401]
MYYTINQNSSEIVQLWLVHVYKTDILEEPQFVLWMLSFNTPTTQKVLTLAEVLRVVISKECKDMIEMLYRKVG